MCITPSNLDDGTVVGCRECWQCRKNRINDYVGRCIAEQIHSVKTLAVTLTYTGDTPNSATLVYEDVQNFMKRLRFAGFDVRYIVAGEYGSKKGRAHWHMVLFFKNRAPNVKIEQRVAWKYWTNEAEGRGFVYFQDVDYNGFQYLMKYALKDQDQSVSVTHLGMSKKPVLGYEYFIQKADQWVDEGLDPQSFVYSFPHVFDKRGRRRKFMLQGRMREIFIDRFLHGYEQKHGREYPHWDIEIIAKELDKRAREEMDEQLTDEQYQDRRTERVFYARLDRFKEQLEYLRAEYEAGKMGETDYRKKKAEIMSAAALLTPYREPANIERIQFLHKDRWDKPVGIVAWLDNETISIEIEGQTWLERTEAGLRRVLRQNGLDERIAYRR